MIKSEREREREFKICSAEKLLLVKILFEEIRFKASFKRRKRRTVTESDRKRIPDLDSREAKGTTTMLFEMLFAMMKSDTYYT